MTGIYKITNNINGKIYIGQAVNIAARWKEHLYRPFKDTYDEYNSHLYNSIRLYGIENFSFSVVEICAEEELNEKEIFWIDFYNSYNPSVGYNSTLGGGGTCGKGVFLDIDSANEIKNLLTETNMTQWEIASEFHIDQATVSYINIGDLWFDDECSYPLRDRNCSKSTDEKSNVCVDCGVKIHKKSTRCVECAKKERLRQYSKPSIEELQNTLIECKGSASQAADKYGVAAKTIRVWCKEYGISYNVKDYVDVSSDSSTHKWKRAVQQVDIKTHEIIHEFESITEATRKTGITHIVDVCKGKREQSGGYFWKYKNNES